MKKIIMTAAAVFALTFANAQDAAPEKKQGMHLGVKAGYVNSNITGDVGGADFDTDTKSGAYFGGFLDLSISNKFHVQPEVLYSMEGGGEDNVGVDNGLDFIVVPIMAKYYITDSFNIQAGPQIAFVAGGDDEIKDAAKSNDFRVGLGAAWEFGLLFIDARYNWGLSDMYDGPGEGEIKTQSFNVGLGLRF